MAETEVEGLSGTEIIDDILAHVKRTLLTSCDLRDSDSYGQGYSGEIKISLKLYGMDATPGEFTVQIPPKGAPPVSTEEITIVPLEIEQKIEIPQEENLDAVRERTKEEPPVPEAQPQEEARMPQRLRRKYNKRKVSLETTPSGGAVDLETLPEGE
jgi:hypothetical protein